MTLFGPKELASLLTHEATPSLVRQFWCVVSADVDQPTVTDCPRHKATSLALARHNTTRQKSVVLSAVPHVLLVGRLAQIVPAIIRRLAILMVDRLGPSAGLNDPDQTMCSELACIHEDTRMPIPVRTTCWFSGKATVPFALRRLMLEVMQRSCFPRQDAGSGIVGKALTQIIGCRQPFSWHLQSWEMVS